MKLIVMKITSHPSRGAWIEIGIDTLKQLEYARRTPRGVRGLKFYWLMSLHKLGLVAPLAGCVD